MVGLSSMISNRVDTYLCIEDQISDANDFRCPFNINIFKVISKFELDDISPVYDGETGEECYLARS